MKPASIASTPRGKVRPQSQEPGATAARPAAYMYGTQAEGRQGSDCLYLVS